MSVLTNESTDGPLVRLRRMFRVLYRLTVLNMSMALAYRGEFAIFMLQAIATPVVSLLIWRTALANGVDLRVGTEYVTTYFVLLGVVGMLTSSWIAGFLAEEIREGKLSIWLVRPASTHLHGISNNVSEKVLKGFWHLPAVVGLWWIFSESVRLPADPQRWLLFTVSVLLAAMLVYTLDVLIAALAFWFDDVSGIHRAYDVFAGVLSGAVVPLALMPGWAQEVLAFQPFRYTVSFPLELIVGELSWSEIGLGFALQVGYVGLALLVTRWVWRAGMRSYSAVGA